MKSYEWAIVGGGVAGIAVSEILTRQGHSVVLIDKGEKLASETTRDFHEWIHTGALYTLVPDRLITLRFILGAIDDLIAFYSNFERMNLSPTTSGLNIEETNGGGWFSPNYIHFKYRIKGRKITLPWLIGVARSLNINERLHKHDWLRRRAGELDPLKSRLWTNTVKKMPSLLKYKEKYFDYKTTDFTTNSRILLRDIITTAITNGLDISLNNKVKKIDKQNKGYIVEGENECFQVDKIAICAGSGITKFTDAKIKTSYAPIAVVEGISHNTNSFVELDYFPKNCINILTKEDGVGLIGGITLNNIEKCDEYIDFVIKKHKQMNPNLKVLEKYIGKKNELIFNNEDRNYLYHISPIPDYKNVWSIIPGKFTLAFSLAPEFYRQVYSKNPIKVFNSCIDEGKYSSFISNTAWFDSLKNN
jgi:hypothetical protein